MPEHFVMNLGVILDCWVVTTAQDAGLAVHVSAMLLAAERFGQ